MKLYMKNGLLHILCLMAILAFHACVHEWFDRDEHNLNPAIDEARSYFEENATDLSMPQLLIPPQTKTDDIFSGGNLVPVWDRFISAENDRFTTFELPLSRDFAMRAAIFYSQGDKHRFVTAVAKVKAITEAAEEVKIPQSQRIHPTRLIQSVTMYQTLFRV